RHDRPEDADRRLVLDRLRGAIRRAQRVEGLVVERVVDQGLAQRALAGAQPVGDLLRVASRAGEVVDGVPHLVVERVVLRQELPQHALAERRFWATTPRSCTDCRTSPTVALTRS